MISDVTRTHFENVLRSNLEERLEGSRLSLGELRLRRILNNDRLFNRALRELMTEMSFAKGSANLEAGDEEGVDWSSFLDFLEQLFELISRFFL